jgi:hypothetical protein
MKEFTRECPTCGRKAVAALKRQLLEHYATKQPAKFLQLDGFTDCGAGDSVMHPDENGDCCMSTWCDELRSGGIAVRVQILEGTPHIAACRVLERLLAWLKDGTFGRNADGRLVDERRDFISDAPISF